MNAYETERSKLYRKLEEVNARNNNVSSHESRQLEDEIHSLNLFSGVKLEFRKLFFEIVYCCGKTD